MDTTNQSIEAMRNAYPLDAALFGTTGAAMATLCKDIGSGLVGRRYAFMNPDEFKKIRSIPQMNQVYWNEILFRVHWAAGMNVMRHRRWQSGCIAAADTPANFLSFVSSLRGLIEASLDAYYSLSGIPGTLADHRAEIQSALEGKMLHPSVSGDLEDRLIHFIYGRKLAKAERSVVPPSHEALEPRDYRNAIGLPEGDRESFRQLYDELCGICHPTAFSLTWLWTQPPGGPAEITGGDDKAEIMNLCKTHGNTIEFAISLSVVASALCLKLLNWFSLPEVWCTPIEHWNLDCIPAWKKIMARLSHDMVH